MNQFLLKNFLLLRNSTSSALCKIIVKIYLASVIRLLTFNVTMWHASTLFMVIEDPIKHNKRSIMEKTVAMWIFKYYLETLFPCFPCDLWTDFSGINALALHWKEGQNIGNGMKQDIFWLIQMVLQLNLYIFNY